MTAPTLEELAERVAALEQAMALMQSRADRSVKKGWETTYGVFRGDSVMKEIMDAGKRIRDAEPPVGGYSLDVLRERREEILKVAATHGASNVRVFGSVARGDANDESDVDLLVDLDPERSLLDHAGLMIDLQELLHVRIDVATVAGLKPRIRERVLQEAVAL